MEQKVNIDWHQIALKEYARHKQTVQTAKQMLNKTTGYAKYLEQQNYSLEERVTRDNEKLQKAILLIKNLQSLANKQKDELRQLQSNNEQLAVQLEQQTKITHSEMTAHAKTEHELANTEHELAHTKLKLQDALTLNNKTVTENNWQEFFVFRPTDAALQ